MYVTLGFLNFNIYSVYSNEEPFINKRKSSKVNPSSFKTIIKHKTYYCMPIRNIMDYTLRRTKTEDRYMIATIYFCVNVLPELHRCSMETGVEICTWPGPVAQTSFGFRTV
jgi:hypothetical protein